MYEYFSVSECRSKLAPGVVFKLKKLSKGRRSSFNFSIAKIADEKSKLQRQLTPISDELNRAEEAAKVEPCTCTHEKSIPASKAAELEKVNERLEVKVEVVDGCHSSITKRCLIEGCDCRKAKPDPQIGDYEKYQSILSSLHELEQEQMAPARLRFFISDIQGLKIDGREADVELLLSDGPEPLVEEVSDEITRLLSLSPDELLGFQRPTTGGDPVGNQGTEITAPSTATSVNQASTTADDIVGYTSPI